MPYSQVYNRRIKVKNIGTFSNVDNAYVYVSVSVNFDKLGKITNISNYEVYYTNLPNLTYNDTWSTPKITVSIINVTAYTVYVNVSLYVYEYYYFNWSITNWT
ncbi:MAG: hypothetical protein WBO70_07800 [Erysipelotrichaceae bacterium]